MESGTPAPSTPPNDRIPRGAIVVVIIGVLACVAAALLTSGKGSGEAAHLEWVQQAPIPDSKAVVVPGSKEAHMQLVNGKIQATGTNVAGRGLFRVLTTAKIDENAPVGQGRVLCSVHATRRTTEIDQSYGGLRGTYPRSSEKGTTGNGVPEGGIYNQEAPELVTMQFASHGYELAYLEVGDIPHSRFSSIQGIKLAWPEYEEGTEHLEYFLPEGKNKPTIELPFYTIWVSEEPPAAKIACKLEVAAGKVSAETEGSLPKVSPPINEEAEEEKQEEREENGEAAGESEEAESEGE
jgi:hypothetical protein